MTSPKLIGPWVRRFLLEHVVGERNLSINTQRSYRDMLTLFLPFAAKQSRKAIDRLEVVDLSPDLIRSFLTHLEQARECSLSTHNQRLGGLHALARFVGEHSPEHLDWCTQVRLIPFKKTTQAWLVKLKLRSILEFVTCFLAHLGRFVQQTDSAAPLGRPRQCHRKIFRKLEVLYFSF